MKANYIKAFCFNPFSENTYVVYNDEGDAWIIDPGCYEEREEIALQSFVESHGLSPKRLLLTHAHIDHIFGVKFVEKTWGLKAELNENDQPIFDTGSGVAAMYGLHYQKPDLKSLPLEEGQILMLGYIAWSCIWVPGHSPGSICFYSANDAAIIGGDVLFEGSIGRTDLPGGNHSLLLNSIKEKLFSLPKDTTVYPGHGGTTTIGQELLTNPFF